MTVDALGAFFISKINFWFYALLMCIGLYAILVKRNYVKKIIGLNILQTSIILFFISISAKRDATIPIIEAGRGGYAPKIDAVGYINPLPHVLMLTAIVVAVATLGVALALAIKIYHYYGTLEEDELAVQIATDEDKRSERIWSPKRI